MKLSIDTRVRRVKKVELSDSGGNRVGFLQGQGDLIELIDQILKANQRKVTDLKEIEAKLEGESRVGILIGSAAANALNYALGLKSLDELEFPSRDASQGSVFLLNS